MSGVYRIQTFFGFLYIFYIYKAPKLVENKKIYIKSSIKITIIKMHQKKKIIEIARMDIMTYLQYLQTFPRNTCL